MAATKLSPSPMISRSLTEVPQSPGFLETVQLMEPKQTKTMVPNHILDSKIYSKIAHNDCIQAQPAVVHFGGMEIGKLHKQTIKLINTSTEVQRLHIIPPQSKYFKIKYTKQERFVPGLTLDCVVEFTPDEWRYYYDCIRLHCKSEENLFIPIHAYPIISTDDFPAKINFPPVPVGRRTTRIIPLRCFAPIDFEFQIQIPQPHPAFTVHPKTGVVPASGEIDVAVSFCPVEFSTAHMTMQLLVSQFNSKPLTCRVTGTSTPGLAKEISESQSEESYPDILDPRCITPVERAREKRKIRKALTSSSTSARSGKTKKEIERNGIRFPADLNTPYAVAQVLNQQPGKLRTKDIRDVVTTKKKQQKKITRQMKEAMFEVATRDDLHEERQNQLRWQVKLGDAPMSEQARQNILREREQAWADYKTARGDPVEEKECTRACTECSFRRTIRDGSVVEREGAARFDPYSNDTWAARHAALSRFQQAARKVIVRKRAQCRLRLLREAMVQWRKHGIGVQTPGEASTLESSTASGKPDVLSLDASRIRSVTFPHYVDPNVKDDMAVDALGAVTVKPTEVVVRKKTPYFDLKVPQYYTLLGYTRHDTHEASLNYVPFKPTRQLRTGAEDEIKTLPDSALAAVLPAPPAPLHTDLPLEDVTEATLGPEGRASTAVEGGAAPGTELTTPEEYSPLHVFNPMPGLQVFQAPLPYSETDSDFHLCPLPRYVNHDAANPHRATQKQYLDREETIKGVMTWKKFPCQGLTSLTNTPTLTSVWVPRWSDPFCADLLPHEIPALYSSLPEDDSAHVQQDDHGTDSDHVQLQLTPEMVNSMFPSIEEEPQQEKETQGATVPVASDSTSSTEPASRETKEKELNSFVQKKYNRLGNRIQQRVNAMNNLKTDPNLKLK